MGSWGDEEKGSEGNQDLQLQIQGGGGGEGFALRKSKQKQDKQVFGRLISVIFH
jgi:hypothetical protein